MWHSDLFPFFRQPKESTVTLSLGVSSQLCTINPDRVVLLISSTTGQNIFLTTDPKQASAGGFEVPIDNQPFILTQAKHGALAQVAWFTAGSTGGGTICVIEVILDRKPTWQDIHA